MKHNNLSPTCHPMWDVVFLFYVFLYIVFKFEIHKNKALCGFEGVKSRKCKALFCFVRHATQNECWQLNHSDTQ